MREIMQREIVCRNRFSVLQSTGKNFEKEINAFLQIFKAKEATVANGSTAASATSSNLTTASSSSMNASQIIGLASQAPHQSQGQQPQPSQQRSLGYNRFDQERYAIKDETGGFSIDTSLE